MPHTTLLFRLSLFVYAAGCMEHKPPSHSIGIAIVSSEDIDIAKSQASSRLKAGPGDYERWEHLHEKVKSALGKYGSVSWDPEPLPDFYFSGDWFHENSDGYSICSSKPITKDLLKQLPKVLASHHKDAMLQMDGTEQPVDGLVILATSTGVLVGWDGLDRNACEQRLREVGIELH